MLLPHLRPIQPKSQNLTKYIGLTYLLSISFNKPISNQLIWYTTLNSVYLSPNILIYTLYLLIKCNLKFQIHTIFIVLNQHPPLTLKLFRIEWLTQLVLTMLWPIQMLSIEHSGILNREVYFMNFPKLPNFCFRNDGIMDRLLRLF